MNMRMRLMLVLEVRLCNGEETDERKGRHCKSCYKKVKKQQISETADNSIDSKNIYFILLLTICTCFVLCTFHYIPEGSVVK